MKYEEITCLSDEQFRRLTGIKRITFSAMVEILEKEFIRKKSRGGRPNKITIPNMLLMTLEYLREYRTYFHIAPGFGLSESTAYKTIKWVEDVLIKNGTFSLPGRKELLKSDLSMEVILIDASESPVERPQKNKNNITQARRKDIH
jgi:hypothetical protein